MHFNHKPGLFLRFCFLLIFILSAGSLIVLNSSMIYADDEQESEVISQNSDNEQMFSAVSESADDEQMTEEMAKKIKELDVITIENKGYLKDRKGPAKLEHVKHAREYQISCWECHHEYKDKDEQQVEQPAETANSEQGEEAAQNEEPKPKYLTEQNIWSPWGITKKCSECHDPKEKKDDVIKLQAAYHKNCKNCHMDRRIYDNDVLAYRKCTSCHQE